MYVYHTFLFLYIHLYMVFDKLTSRQTGTLTAKKHMGAESSFHCLRRI